MKRSSFIGILPGFLLAAGIVSSAWAAETHNDQDGHDHAKETKSNHDNHDDHDGHDHGKTPDAKSSKTAHKADDGHDHSADGKEAEEPPIHLTEAQKKLIRIQLSKAKPGDLANTIRLHGEIFLNQEETAKLMPRMPGFVTKILVREGERVKKGQLLALLTSHKLGEYYSNYNSALELEKLADSEYRMAEKLRSSNATSQKEYLRYKREYADAKIARKRAEELLNSLRLDPTHNDHPHTAAKGGELPICTDYEIRSPIAGSIIGKNITLGENFAEDNTAIVFTVSNLDHLWLELQAGSAELGIVRKGMSVQVKPSGSEATFQGKIIYVSPIINPQTRTGFIRIEVDNQNGRLRPGQFVTGIIRLDTKEKTVLIPRDAVQLIGGESVVFVPQGDGFAPKVVLTGASAQGFTQIISGLKPDDLYVSSGAFELKSVLLTSGMDAHAGHGH